MNKIYLFGMIGVIVCGAYFYGLNVADAKCRAQIAVANLQSLQNLQNQTIKTKKENHEIVYKTGVHDIRRILRDKYTINE